MKTFYLIATLFALLALFIVPVAGAQGVTPPPAPVFPPINELLKMTLGALGAFVFISVAGYLWGWVVSAVLARLPFTLPTWLSDALIAVPLAGLAAMWNAFAAFLNIAYPGLLDKSVGDALLWVVNWIMALFFSRKGGIANVSDLTRWIRLSAATAADGRYDAMLGKARSAVLLLE